MKYRFINVFQRDSFLAKLIAWTDRGVNPRYSVIHLVLIKLRILAEWIVRRILLFPNHRRALSKLKNAKNSKSECHALVLANGPSVNKLNFDVVRNLQKEKKLELVGVNFFPIVSASHGLHLDHLVLSDPVTIPSVKSERNSKLWDWISNNPKTAIYVPTNWTAEFDESKLVEQSRVFFFDDTCLLGWSSNISPLKARGYASLTAYKALAISVFLGFNTLNIIGFDNDQFKFIRVTDDNEIFQDPNHFTEYASEHNLTDILLNGISDYFYDTGQVFADLHLFRKKDILNLDNESLIDCFPKAKHSSMVKANR
jgi:hypothetical protein